MFLALLRKKPVLWISFSSFVIGRAYSAAGVEYLANNSLVTMFTRTSVHCAERIVAISSSNGESWTSAHSTSGYSRFSRRTIRGGVLLRGQLRQSCAGFWRHGLPGSSGWQPGRG